MPGKPGNVNSLVAFFAAAGNSTTLLGSLNFPYASETCAIMHVCKRYVTLSNEHVIFCCGVVVPFDIDTGGMSYWSVPYVVAPSIVSAMIARLGVFGRLIPS